MTSGLGSRVINLTTTTATSSPPHAFDDVTDLLTPDHLLFHQRKRGVPDADMGRIVFDHSMLLTAIFTRQLAARC